MKEETAPGVSNTQTTSESEEMTELLEMDAGQIESDDVKTLSDCSKDKDLEFIFYRHLERIFRRN